MPITDDELREIYTNAPVVKDTFEVITIKASWFSRDYHLQHAFTEDIDVELETSEIVTAEYAPMRVNQANSNADMVYERTIDIQQVNDIIASEVALRDPESTELPVVESRGYVMYRDGTVSQLKTAVIRTEISKTTRNEVGTSISSSTKPVNAQATGTVVTTTLVPMLKGFL
jgi:hypothetical protein